MSNRAVPGCSAIAASPSEGALERVWAPALVRALVLVLEVLEVLDWSRCRPRALASRCCQPVWRRSRVRWESYACVSAHPA